MHPFGSFPPRASRLLASLAGWSFAAGALAAAKAPASPNYGTTGASSYIVGACDAAGLDESQTFSAPSCSVILPLSTVAVSNVGFPLHLPTGALVTSISMNYFDTDPLSNPSAFLLKVVPGSNEILLSMDPPDFSGGLGAATFDAKTPLEIESHAAYAIQAILTRTAESITGIYNFEVHYKLQVSPAPAVATFTDVPTDHPFFQFIEALAASGITGGCGGGNYCPDNPVTRGQMAVFVSKALGLYFPN